MLLALAMPSFANAGTTGVLRGRITDRRTGEPVSGARVVAASPVEIDNTTTDAHGFYVFPSLMPGRYTVSAEHAGLAPTSRAGMVVAADAATNASIGLIDCFDCGIGRFRFTPPAVFMFAMNRDVTILKRDTVPGAGIRSILQSMTFVPGIVP